MIRKRTFFSFLFVAVIASVAGTRNTGWTHPSGPEVTFAQLTDAHLFDEGWKQPVAEAYREAAENWKALHWSIDRLNALVQSGKTIDFVVYTGDLGLQNVAFPQSEICVVGPVHLEPGLPPTEEETATKELTLALDRLLVRKAFFLSGNNDPMDEDASDGRFDCFLSSLQVQAAALSRPLDIQKLGPDSRIEVKGVRLLGLNTESFKKAANYRDVCVPRVQKGLLQQVLDSACPETELGVLGQHVSAGAPTLLFTHVPDLQDDIGRSWQREASQANVLGLFAGHLHDSRRALYGTAAGLSGLAVTPGVAGKTVVAPPLAIKNQLGKPGMARGFLLAKVTRTGIKGTEVMWFNDGRSY